jgi:hypothetical protein
MSLDVSASKGGTAPYRRKLHAPDALLQRLKRERAGRVRQDVTTNPPGANGATGHTGVHAQVAGNSDAAGKFPGAASKGARVLAAIDFFCLARELQRLVVRQTASAAHANAVQLPSSGTSRTADVRLSGPPHGPCSASPRSSTRAAPDVFPPRLGQSGRRSKWDIVINMIMEG